MATNFGIVKKSGAWFSFEEDRFQGREQFRQKLIETPEMYQKLEDQVKEKLNMKTNKVITETNDGKEKTSAKEKKSSK
jgi:recombination protein RecA